MTLKNTFNGPIVSGIDRGAPALDTLADLRFTVLTTVQTSPVTNLVVAVLPKDARLTDINVISRAAIVGEATMRFASVAGGSDNLGFVTLSAAGRYNAYIDSATAQTTFPFGKSPTTGDTVLYLSTGATSGSLTSLQGNVLVEVTYTRVDYSERPDIRNNGNLQATRYQGPIRFGKDNGQALTPIGFARMGQGVTVNSAPVTARLVGVLPPGGKLTNLSVYTRAAVSTGQEAVIRFEVGTANGGSNLGSVSVSGARKYTVTVGASQLSALPYAVNNTTSALPIYMSIVPASTTYDVSALAGNLFAEVGFVRLDESRGYPGQKATTFQEGAFTGVERGQYPFKELGAARFSQITTVIPNLTTGVASSQQVGFIPSGHMLIEANWIQRETLGGSARVRFTTLTDFASNNLGQTASSAQGVYSIMQSTAAITIPGQVNTGEDIPVYVSVLALAGSITPLTAGSMIEIITARMDPRQYGGN